MIPLSVTRKKRNLAENVFSEFEHQSVNIFLPSVIFASRPHFDVALNRTGMSGSRLG